MTVKPSQNAGVVIQDGSIEVIVLFLEAFKTKLQEKIQSLQSNHLVSGTAYRLNSLCHLDLDG